MTAELPTVEELLARVRTPEDLEFVMRHPRFLILPRALVDKISQRLKEASEKPLDSTE